LETGHHSIELYLGATVVRIGGGAGPAIGWLGADPDFTCRRGIGGKRSEREQNCHC